MSPRHLHRCLFVALALCALAGEGAWAERPGGRPPPTDQAAADATGGYDAPYRDPRRDRDGSQDNYPNGYQRGYPGGYQGGPRNDGLPASVRRIQRQTGGQVLRAQPYERDGREVYRVKVLTPQGRIRVYEDDPGAERGGPPAPYPRQAPPPRYQEQAAMPAQGRPVPPPQPPVNPRRSNERDPGYQRPPPMRSLPPAMPPRLPFERAPGRRRGG